MTTMFFIWRSNAFLKLFFQLSVYWALIFINSQKVQSGSGIERGLLTNFQFTGKTRSNFKTSMTFNKLQVKTSKIFVLFALDSQLQLLCFVYSFLGIPHYFLIQIFHTEGLLKKYTPYLNQNTIQVCASSPAQNGLRSMFTIVALYLIL